MALTASSKSPFTDEAERFTLLHQGEAQAMIHHADKQLHHEICFVGLRAQATAVGLVQLCIELRRAGVLDEAAVGRIKESIACEISLGSPRSIPREVFGKDIRARLDRLFRGQEKIGGAETLAFGAPEAETARV